VGASPVTGIALNYANSKKNGNKQNALQKQRRFAVAKLELLINLWIAWLVLLPGTVTGTLPQHLPQVTLYVLLSYIYQLAKKRRRMKLKPTPTSTQLKSKVTKGCDSEIKCCHKLLPNL